MLKSDMRRERQLSLFLVSVLVVSMIGGGHVRSSLSQRPICSGDYAPGIVLVGFDDFAPGPRFDDLAQATVGLSRLTVGPKMPGTGVATVQVPVGQECAALRALREESTVAFAELDYAVQTTDAVVPNDPGWSTQWGPGKINAPSAWDVTMGTSDVVIAVLDTGVRLSHEDLADTLWSNPGEIPSNGTDDDLNGKIDDFWGWHFFHEWAWDGTQYTYLPGEDHRVGDDNGHGTHVTGITGAEVNNGVGIAGVAGGSRVMVVKVLDEHGNGWYSDLAQGVVYAVDNGADVINLSVGGRFPSDTLKHAVDYARDHGVLIVAAAGNVDPQDDYSAVLYPAAYDNVLAVAATNENDTRAELSKHGPEIDVGAPGKDIYSTWYITEYLSQSGTSMAAPHVSGLAALLWSALPDMPVEWVTQVITSTAADVNGDTYPDRDEYLGWGRIDAGHALSVATRMGALRLTASEYSLPVGGATTITATFPVTAGGATPIIFSASGGVVDPEEMVAMEGIATTTLAAGSLAGPTVITATAETVTGVLSLRLTPGPAVSGTLTASVGQCMPGQSVSLILQAADRFGNNPLDGIAIDWRADGGTVSPSRSSFHRGEGVAAFVSNGIRDTGTITASWPGGTGITTTVDVVPFAYHFYLPTIYHHIE